MMNWEKLLSSKRSGEGTTTQHLNRSRFEQDYDRIIFSQPFRRLQDKTQVFPLPEDDFVHNRLTHSLEVSSVGRSLGKIIGDWVTRTHQLDEVTAQDFGAIVGAASLAHDLGNPPFGHSGEDCISSFYVKNENFFRESLSNSEWLDLTHFEGNAQGFRILNSKLYGGLKLTHATLGAFTKYPLSSNAEKTKGRKSQKKYGYYQSDKALFKDIAHELGLAQLNENAWIRHPLTFLVEAADDICYHIIDLEDGCRLGLVDFETVNQLLKPIIGKKYSEEKVSKIPTLNERIGSLRALAISNLITECAKVFQENEKKILAGEYDRALTDDIDSSAYLRAIITISIEKIYRSKIVVEKEAGGFKVIDSLLSSFAISTTNQLRGKKQYADKAIINLIPDPYRYHIEQTNNHYQILQLVNDFVSGLTDTHAVRLFKILNGISIN